MMYHPVASAHPTDVVDDVLLDGSSQDPQTPDEGKAQHSNYSRLSSSPKTYWRTQIMILALLVIGT
jgi:hypothetical protein